MFPKGKILIFKSTQSLFLNSKIANILALESKEPILNPGPAIN